MLPLYGGPDGEIGASMRYLSQRFSMPNRKIMGVLNDIGREAPEMFHSSEAPPELPVETLGVSGANAFFRPVCGETSGGRFPVDAFATV